MIAASLKPRSKRLPVRGKAMTLVAAFRCHRGGLLLCADREESDGTVKRETDKIAVIELPAAQVFIAGAGPSSVVNQAVIEIRQVLQQALATGESLERQHKPLIEDTLKSIHKRYAANLKEWSLGLIVIFAPFDRSTVPLLYRSEYSMLVSEPFYVGYGAGKALSDYLADRLYDYNRIDDTALLAIASFIFREVEHSVGGVGLGVDMMFIREGSPFGLKIGKDHIKAIQEKIPPLGECVLPSWNGRFSIPADLIP
jgi:20S proteasome alpha/beta subunit